MGLDVYLYKYENFDAAQEREKKIEAFEDEVWEGRKYDEMTESERDAIFRRIELFRQSLVSPKAEVTAEDKLTRTNRKIQVDNPTSVDEIKQIDTDVLYGREEIQKPSERYPNHLYRVGYFRSSYNDGGINNVLGRLLNVTLYDLFDVQRDDYYIKPEWDKVKERTRAALDILNQCIAEGNDYTCLKVNPSNIFGSDNSTIMSEQDAIALIIKEKKEHSSGFGSFSNKHGEFFLDKPVQVSAIIKGRDTLFHKSGLPCVYVVYKNSDGLEWYAQALEIIEETCDYVLQQSDKDKYYLHWSG